jgi:hypothetical protein
MKAGAGALAAASIAPRLSRAAVVTTADALPPDVSGYADLLKTWCDGLLAQQINDTPDLKLLGAFRCPACGVLHGRCADALYPMMRMAHTTGDSKYLDAAIKLQRWSDNVTLPTGEFTNELDPASWKGITVFAMIALGDALHHHGQLLDDGARVRWRDRLARAAKFLDGWITMETGNINYPVTSSLAFTVAGEVLGEQHYLDRGKEFAHHALEFFTTNHLLYGENHPATLVTPKGCRPVDLGYNVEESLPALALYAMRTKDQPVLDAVVASLQAHMEFMLPDGAWDNSWGTRMFKWTWWGSRTSDGCFPAYALLADRDPRFAEVARRNLSLMKSCTHDGLLYGGPHLHLNGDRPCVHHTFTHAKSLATVLEAGVPVQVTGGSTLPRDDAHSIKRFDELATRLIATGPWRATITDYDQVYYKRPTGHPTGGALSLLYHMTLGPICVASMTEYALVEPNNMQKHGDYPTMPLTPRVEVVIDNQTYTSLSDNDAKVEQQTRRGVAITAVGRLLNAKGEPPKSEASYKLIYQFEASPMITASVSGVTGAKIVLPIVSPKHEEYQRINDTTVRIKKENGLLEVKTGSQRGLTMLPDRVFNLVPGMQCLVFTVDLEPDTEASITLS